MATEQNFDRFRLGEDWTITLDCADGSGAALDLTGGNVRFRLSLGPGNPPLLDLSTAGGVSILNPTSGVAIIAVTPAMQTAAALVSRLYCYEAQAVLSDGTVSDQAFGTFLAQPSLFA